MGFIDGGRWGWGQVVDGGLRVWVWGEGGPEGLVYGIVFLWCGGQMGGGCFGGRRGFY